MTHSSFVAPASLNFAPAPSPAIVLGLADVGDRAEVLEVVRARVERDDRDAGVDAPSAATSFSASGFGAETARPSTFSVTAASISCACFCGSLLDSEYFR